MSQTVQELRVSLVAYDRAGASSDTKIRELSEALRAHVGWRGLLTHPDLQACRCR
jgi:hypothetical protein